MKLIDKTTFKFLLVGVFNTIVGTGTMFLMYNLFHFNYWLSSASNYVVGSIVSYVLNKHFTFKSKKKTTKSILLFIVNISVCYLVAYGIAKPLSIKIMGAFDDKIKDNVAMLVGMCLFVILNYIGQRFIVFRNTEEGLVDEE